jgi:ATP-dependent DNA helicase RecQ
LGIITDHCETSGVSLDESPPVQQVAPSGPTASAIVSFEHFEAGMSVDEVAKKIGRASSTVRGYLCDYIRHQKITDPSRWVDSESACKISAAIETVGIGPLKPVYVELDEAFDYDAIRIVMECKKNDSTDNS